jgi:uncharacterized protein
MKYIFLILFICNTAIAQQTQFPGTLPNPTGYVNDYANILSPSQEKRLTTTISTFKLKTTNQLAVVIIDSLNGTGIEEYALALFNKWGIGTKEKDNGVLLLFSMKERKMRIATGYGIEKIMTDADCKKIIETILVPHFKQKKYFGGINAAIKDIIRRLKATTGHH